MKNLKEFKIKIDNNLDEVVNALGELGYRTSHLLWSEYTKQANSLYTYSEGDVTYTTTWDNHKYFDEHSYPEYVLAGGMFIPKGAKVIDVAVKMKRKDIIDKFYWGETEEEIRKIENKLFELGFRYHSYPAEACIAKYFPGYVSVNETGLMSYGLARDGYGSYSGEGDTKLLLNCVLEEAITEKTSQINSEENLKDTNPKKQYASASLPVELWPPIATAYGCLALHNGRLKYGLANYKATPVEASIYLAGALRHLYDWADGNEFDLADNVPNLGAALANIAILLEAKAVGTLIDDRAISGGYAKERPALVEIVKHLNELHKDKSPKHYYMRDKNDTK